MVSNNIKLNCHQAVPSPFNLYVNAPRVDTIYGVASLLDAGHNRIPLIFRNWTRTTSKNHHIDVRLSSDVSSLHKASSFPWSEQVLYTYENFCESHTGKHHILVSSFNPN